MSFERVTHTYLVGLRSDARALRAGSRSLRSRADEIRAASRRTRADAEHRYATYVAKPANRGRDRS